MQIILNVAQYIQRTNIVQPFSRKLNECAKNAKVMSK